MIVMMIAANATFGRSPMHALAGPDGGDYLAGGWVDDGVPVDHHGWDRAHEGGSVGIRPDIHLVHWAMMPPQDEAQTQAEYAAWSPIQRDLRTSAGLLGGVVHGSQSTTVRTLPDGGRAELHHIHPDGWPRQADAAEAGRDASVPTE
jgi:hypothetical protein